MECGTKLFFWWPNLCNSADDDETWLIEANLSSDFPFLYTYGNR